jgi:Domain of unknown function (DUF4395)
MTAPPASLPAQSAPPSGQLDPRGLRFAAALTTVVLAIALATGNVVVLAVQTIVFAAGALLGPRFSPYGLLYARVIRPHVGPPAVTEDPRPPRFAQGVGLAFALIGLVAELTGLGALAVVAIAFALVAAFLNAAFSFCLGCQLYLLGRARFGRPARVSAR